ncbi:hypothetical protein B0J14DRAFT_642724 [Halenospora varia]|nr:hypothetical protein B0J14DRAFT_642724 [Halenospora varia]
MNWWRKKENLTGKTVWIVGGSKGLGKEIAKILTSQGANVTIFARSPTALKEARLEILEARRVATQVVKAVAADMSLSSSVNKIVNAQSALPDILYLVAGGTPTECGFIPEVSDEAVERCMRNNYFTSFYPAQVISAAGLKMMAMRRRGGRMGMGMGRRGRGG